MKSTGRFTPVLRKLVHYGYDHCSQCSRPLAKGVAAYAGYTSTGNEIYVGDCCKAHIHELASHIYWWWTNYKRPTPDTVLWRYMDFSKFVALLSSGALHFARADHLGDPFEGARGVAEREPEWMEFCLEYFRRAIRTAPGRSVEISTERVEQEAERLYLEFETVGKREIRSTFATCWHANDGESEALWRLYCPPHSPGIVIRTDFKSLDAALDGAFDIKFGYVQYVDFAKSFAGTYDRIFWKRASLSHEAEVRGVISGELTEAFDRPGISVPINLSRAFKAVVTSPFAPPWFEGVVKATMQRFGIDTPVTRSALCAEPFF